MQQPQQMIPMVPTFPPTNITTEQIQKYLDENKKLILAILENQNLGKLTECAQYQALLQKNLMYLAAIADAQPQAPTMPPQMAPHPAMQAGYFMQHPQATAMAQQSGLFPPRPPLQFNSPHQLQDPLYQQQQQAMQGQIGIRPVGLNNGMNPIHLPESAAAGGGGQPVSSGSKQDGSDAGAGGGGGGGEPQGGAASGGGSGEGKDGAK